MDTAHIQRICADAHAAMDRLERRLDELKRQIDLAKIQLDTLHHQLVMARVR